MRSKKRSAVVPQLSREELIHSALEKTKKRDSLTPEVPENRKLKIGDSVEIGALEDAVVCHVSEDFRFIVGDYIHVQNNYGDPIRTPEIGCWPWHSVILKSSIADSTLTNKKNIVIDNFLITDISGLLSKVLYSGVNFSAEYQRDYVWTLENKTNLIDSIFDGKDIGNFIFLRYDWDVKDEVLDGKQRLTAILDFYTSKYKYNGYYYHELSRFDRNTFRARRLQYAQLDARKFTEADKLRTFLNVNIAGVPQTEEHLKSIKIRLNELEMLDGDEID